MLVLCAIHTLFRVKCFACFVPYYTPQFLVCMHDVHFATIIKDKHATYSATGLESRKLTKLTYLCFLAYSSKTTDQNVLV